MAEHYGVAILPARVRKPKDEAKVENAVLIAQRRILAALCDATFLSLAELNAAIEKIVAVMNAEPFQKREGSRNQVCSSSTIVRWWPNHCRAPLRVWHSSAARWFIPITTSRSLRAITPSLRAGWRAGGGAPRPTGRGLPRRCDRDRARPRGSTYQRRTINAHRPPEPRVSGTRLRSAAQLGTEDRASHQASAQ